MAEGYLDKLAYELEMIAEMAGSLAVEDVSEISDYIDTLQAQLSQQIETDKVPKDMSQFVFSVLSRLSNITARLRYYASEG
jgi:hypothetical protein